MRYSEWQKWEFEVDIAVAVAPSVEFTDPSTNGKVKINSTDDTIKELTVAEENIGSDL